MNNSDIPAHREAQPEGPFSIVATKAAMAMLSNPEKAHGARRAVLRAMKFVEQAGRYPNPVTAIIGESPFSVHLDPKRRLVILLSLSSSFPAVTDDLVEELLPFTMEVSLV